MMHRDVYAEAGIYAGWPANHGAWQRGDEFLVGFLRGPFQRESMHNVGEPLQLMQARSVDGGESWAAEDPNIPTEMEYAAENVPTSSLSLRNSLVRVRGIYDHGGDYVHNDGGYFASDDFGRTWRGPYAFRGIEDVFAGNWHNTSRTSVLCTGRNELVFLSRADKRMWGTDEVFCATHRNGEFALRGFVCNDRGRAVMPAAALIGNRIVVACRRRITNRLGGWIEAFCSEDDGASWRTLGEIGETGKRNGNPPALIEHDGALVCCYANRTDRQMLATISKDAGATWSVPRALRETCESDIGYPQLFKRSDGQLVCVYYWADANNKHQRISSTRFSI